MAMEEREMTAMAEAGSRGETHVTKRLYLGELIHVTPRCHAEDDDIVNGWKGFFARKNAEMETSTGDAEAKKEEAMGDGSTSGYPILSITSEQYTTWCCPWMNSLIIKLLGLSVSKHVLIDRVRRMWKPWQPLKVVPLSNDYYIVSFSSMEDRDYALYESPWMVDNHCLLVQSRRRWWRKASEGGFTVVTADNGRQCSMEETPKLAHRFTGGSKHLGPQMILRRDMRRNNQSIADNVGLKSGIPELSQGVKRGGVNRDTSRGITNGQKLKEITAARSVGLLNTTLNEKDKNKREWVVVGSKRKKEERPKLNGKENRSGG
ncbi:hypothetical protein K1719_004113 [Acacia pycnantha]|nr:hypothetical protein K1719_004113 [Acacia pycnantha]